MHSEAKAKVLVPLTYLKYLKVQQRVQLQQQQKQQSVEQQVEPSEIEVGYATVVESRCQTAVKTQ